MKLRQGSPFRLRYCRRSAVFDVISVTMFTVIFCFMANFQSVTTEDQWVSTAKIGVVRVVRVDVPLLVRSYDEKTDQGTGLKSSVYLGCAFALEGGENDDENGDVVPTKATPTATVHKPLPVLKMDAAMEKTLHARGFVVKWYFRRNPVPAEPRDMLAMINDNEQVYQWIPGSGPEAGGPLGPLIGHVVDVSDQTQPSDNHTLHRILRVDRPSYDLTGEYRCQVEDWFSERRSPWHPMVVYSPERVFKVFVDDNDDDDEGDIAEGSDSEVNFTTPALSTSSNTPPTISKNSPTEINITCYAAGVHPEPSMSIWVNGVILDNVTMTVTDDDGDDDETNDGAKDTKMTTTTTTTTTPRPKFNNRNWFRNNRDVGVFKKYGVRADSVVSLRQVEEHRKSNQSNQYHRRRNIIEVECRLRVPGDGAGDGFWKANRPAGHFYVARKSVSYKYPGDHPSPPSDAFAAASSASSVADKDNNNDGDRDPTAIQDANNAAAVIKSYTVLFFIAAIQSTIVAARY